MHSIDSAELLTQVAQILYHEDPMKINFGYNPDEYDPEASTIVPRLRWAKNETDALDIVYEEFLRWFGGKRYAGPKNKYRVASTLIWEAYKQFPFIHTKCGDGS